MWMADNKIKSTVFIESPVFIWFKSIDSWVNIELYRWFGFDDDCVKWKANGWYLCRLVCKSEVNWVKNNAWSRISIVDALRTNHRWANNEALVVNFKGRRVLFWKRVNQKAKDCWFLQSMFRSFDMCCWCRWSNFGILVSKVLMNWVKKFRKFCCENRELTNEDFYGSLSKVW